ncbi:MAG: bifunctional helix-turn-helix transcriptional regulator/GNAT family N-acetyltransferase [Acidiphilium sp.]
MSDAVDSIRSFNRFFTKFVGALDTHFLGTDMTLAEARLLYEIAHADASLAADLRAALNVDAGYVSRVLQRFEERGWITRERGAGDARRRPIGLTPEGRMVFDQLDARQRAAVTAALDRLDPAQRADLVGALTGARLLLGDLSERRFALRTFRPGDMGMIASRQSILYREVYGWGAGIEVIEGEVTTAFLRDFKPGREQCWVAEVGGVMAGSIFVTDEGDGLCRLRLLYVEPFARGLGIGGALVDTCVRFAREVGYRRVTLWTHTVLESARKIYAAHGFRIVEVHTHEEFGAPVQSETWELDLIGVSA